MRACPRCHSAYVGEVEFCGIDGSQLLETETDPLIGQLVDCYMVVELLGRGAMGSVYRVRHTVLERDFAMKVLFGDLASNKMFAGRFRREAQALSKLHHTNVISVSDFGTTDRGLTYLVMDYVEGTTLAEMIRREAPFYAWRAARIARQIAAGLAEAHRRSLIHRDVKPENIILVSEGDEEIVKLLDFGIVAMEQDGNATKLTGTGRIVGTPTYMAPEQARQGPITAAVDLYALGGILYEMLSGRPPFDGTVPELLVRHAVDPPPDLHACGGLEDLTLQLLAKDPMERPESAAAVISEIDSLVLDWSGVSAAAPLAAPIARSISSSSGRQPSAPGRPVSNPRPTPLPNEPRSTSRPPAISTVGRTLEIGPPTIPPLVDDLAPPPTGTPPDLSSDLLDTLPPALGSADLSDDAPPYDPFLQPDPYYSNVVAGEYDGLLPKGIADPVVVARAQERQPTPVDLMAPSISTSTQLVSQNLYPAEESKGWWQRLGPLLVVLSLLISVIALVLAMALMRVGPELPDPKSAPTPPPALAPK